MVTSWHSKVLPFKQHCSEVWERNRSFGKIKNSDHTISSSIMDDSIFIFLGVFLKTSTNAGE